MDDTPLEVTQKYFEGEVNWPMSKDEVVQTVQSHGAPDDVVEKLRAMDADQFTGINDVHNKLWMDRG